MFNLLDYEFSIPNYVMFPESKDCVSLLFKLFVDSSVPFDIPAYLLRPVLYVVLGLAIMEGTAMPEATIDKNNSLLSRE